MDDKSLELASVQMPTWPTAKYCTPVHYFCTYEKLFKLLKEASTHKSAKMHAGNVFHS